MPTVPTTFVPQVAPQAPGEIGQFQAPGVQPMENLAGPQVARFGQAMTAAGNAAFRLGSAIQDGIDDATTKQADVMAVRGMQQVTDRFLGTLGQQSEKEFAASMAQLSQAGAAAMDTLQNDTQRAMFSPILARNMAMYQSRMSQHRNGQVRVWNTNEAVARSEVNADNAIFAYAQKDEVDADGRPVGMIRYAAYADTAVDEARKAGELMGYAPDSAQMTQLEQKVNDRIASGVVQSLVSQGKFAEAQQFLDAQGTVDSLDPKARQVLGNTVEVKRQGAVINELTESIRETGVLNAKSDPTTYGQETGEGAEPPATLREALEKAEGIEDTEVRKAVQAQLRVQYAQDDALITQEYRAILANRDDWMAVPGNSAADFPQLDRLTPADRKHTYTMQLVNDDPVTLAQIAVDPALVNDEAFMASRRNYLSPTTMARLRKDAASPDKVLAASVDADEMKRMLYDFGMDKYADPRRGDTEAARATLILTQNIEARIDAQQRLSGRTLRPEEKRAIIKDSILDEAYIEAFGRDPKRPIAMMTQPELEKAYVVVGGKEVPYVDYVTSTEFVEVSGQRISRRQYDIAVSALQKAGGMATPELVLMYWEGKGRPK